MRREGGADYGSLSGVLRRTIRDEVIVEHWDELNRLAASLADGLVPPSMLVSKLQGLRRQNAPRETIQELGRLAKTRHLLAYVDDPALRRRVLVGLNRQERLHAMARAIFFGRQARFPEQGHEAQLNRASALSLVINAIVVWNTRYLAAAADHLAHEGRPVPDSAWSHLSPLHWEHLHLVGRYSFNALGWADTCDRCETPAAVARRRQHTRGVRAETWAVPQVAGRGKSSSES